MVDFSRFEHQPIRGKLEARIRNFHRQSRDLKKNLHPEARMEALVAEADDPSCAFLDTRRLEHVGKRVKFRLDF